MLRRLSNLKFSKYGITGARATFKSNRFLLKEKDHEDNSTRFVSTNFPDWIEHWSPKAFYRLGSAVSIAAVTLTGIYGVCQETIIFGGFVSVYWFIGYRDLNQKTHALLRNFPVLGNVRFIFEMFRPELRQYIVESDDDGKPFDRNNRSLIYQRSKNVPDTIPFGTRSDVYGQGYEFACHSMYPKVVSHTSNRVLIGGKDCKQKYSSSILNVSGMSYGALSDNAILALSSAAKLGEFYHNTGEGGVSRFHIDGGGALVWNIGTGYFGCRNNHDGTFSPENFKKTLSTALQIKMIEIKLSQGAKPGHGGLLPAAKVTSYIAEARGVPTGVDCHSPPQHSAFTDAKGLIQFIAKLRDLSDGRPIGFKLCIGKKEEFVDIVQEMLQADIYPDFITVDGAEGGTGAAPPEFSNSVGMPLVEGLTFVNNTLIGAGIRDQIKIICAGKVSSAFSIVRNLALGADVCNAARAMMFALGCIQALKCNTNKCPTGIATQDKDLMTGLDVSSKTLRVRNYHKKTVESVLDIVGAMGYESTSDVTSQDIMKRVQSTGRIATLGELYPRPEIGSLVLGSGPSELQIIWDKVLLRRLTVISTENAKEPCTSSSVEKSRIEL